ncbi:hypothetical protein PGB90_004433 [Kerria lacca]
MPKHRKSSSSDSDSGPDDREPPVKKTASSSSKKKNEDEGWLLGNNRFVKVRDFRGKIIIDIREFYEKDGELLPGKKGIALTAKQWKTFKDIVDEVDQKVSEMA